MAALRGALPFAVERLADVLAPRGCSACDGPTFARAIFCWQCAAAVDDAADEPATVPGIGGIHAGARYGGPVAQAIARLKYGGRADLAEPLAHLALRRFPRPEARALVVPVPLHLARLVERGFNQAALLGRVVARHLGLPFAGEAVERWRATSVQASLSASERRANVADAFTADRARWRGEAALLVDDVVTTGSTLRAAAEALTAAGARRVDALVVAQA